MEALGRGVGAVVRVEGEPGIGKSSLFTEALAGAGQPGRDARRLDPGALLAMLRRR
jgi:hypothetical protein